MAPESLAVVVALLSLAAAWGEARTKVAALQAQVALLMAKHDEVAARFEAIMIAITELRAELRIARRDDA